MNKELLEKLMIKLVTKPVYKTIDKVLNGRATPEEELKGMYSLAVHVVIEIEKGSYEYITLLQEIQGKINALYAKYTAGASGAVPA
jgi:hypothetical protein